MTTTKKKEVALVAGIQKVPAGWRWSIADRHGNEVSCVVRTREGAVAALQRRLEVSLKNTVAARMAVLGITNADACDALGWSPARWHAAVNSVNPRMSTLHVISRVLAVPIPVLLSGAQECAAWPKPEGDHLAIVAETRDVDVEDIEEVEA